MDVCSSGFLHLSALITFSFTPKMTDSLFSWIRHVFITMQLQFKRQELSVPTLDGLPLHCPPGGSTTTFISVHVLSSFLVYCKPPTKGSKKNQPRIWQLCLQHFLCFQPTSAQPLWSPQPPIIPAPSKSESVQPRGDDVVLARIWSSIVLWDQPNHRAKQEREPKIPTGD